MRVESEGQAPWAAISGVISMVTKGITLVNAHVTLPVTRPGPPTTASDSCAWAFYAHCWSIHGLKAFAGRFFLDDFTGNQPLLHGCQTLTYGMKGVFIYIHICTHIHINETFIYRA